MQFALVNGIKTEAIPGGKGICSCCGSETIAKCGNYKIWHWSHKSRKNCDSWWENETEWHRQWKSYFPIENREVIQFDPVSGEKHIADVKTSNQMVIEFQNSPIDIKELQSRERFYQKMIWIVNGEKFKNNFFILSPLPNPDCEFAKDIVFKKQKAGNYKNGLFKKTEGGAVCKIELLFYRKSEKIVDSSTGVQTSVRYHPGYEIEDEIANNYIGHHILDWKKPISVWFFSQKPVFFDFGDSALWWLQDYNDSDLLCVRKIEKQVRFFST